MSMMLNKAASGRAAHRAGMRGWSVPRPLPGVCRMAGPADNRLLVSRPIVSASSASPASATATEDLLLLDHQTFYPYLEAAGDTVVVVDFFTDWCGPCKVIYPELVKLAQERPDIRIVKFNCNRANKELGVKLNIKVAPTFHVYKNSVKLSEMTGAKLEQLIALIDKACEPDAAA